MYYQRLGRAIGLGIPVGSEQYSADLVGSFFTLRNWVTTGVRPAA